MPEIPVYDRKVGIDGGGTPTPQLSGLPASASGVNVSEALSGTGKAIEGAADAAAHIIVYKQKLDSQEKVDTLAEKAASEWQDRAHGDGGWLTRQGEAARGITAGVYPATMNPDGKRTDGQLDYKDTFDGFSAELKERYLSQATTDFERRALNRSLEAHERVYRNAVITHEAQQAKVARHQASEAAVSALMNTGVDAATVGDLQHAMDLGMDKREQALRNDGHSDQNVISAVRMKTADEFAHAAVQANLERDPEAAQSLLNGVKDRLSNGVASGLQDHIDGKMIALRADAINKQIVEDPQSRNDDQTFNLGFVEKKAAELASERPPHERNRLVKMAKEQAMMADSALVQQKQKATGAIMDGFTIMRDKGVPFPEAEKQFMSSDTRMFGQHEIDKLREDGVRIYQRDPDAIKNRLKTMNDDQQSGYANARDIIKTKFSMKSKEQLEGEDYKMTPGRILLRQLDKTAPSMSGRQMVEWVNAQLKDVPTHPAWLTVAGMKFFEGMTPRWKVQAEKELK